MPDTTESRDLLIRLDQKVSDGFDLMNKRFDTYDRRAEALERRVTSLEATLADRPLYISQHNTLLAKVGTLETVHNRVDGMATALKFVFGGGFAVAATTLFTLAKALHAF